MHVIGTNPTTGETKEIEVYAGQRISTYLYNDRKVDSIMFIVENVTERDLPEFLLERLRENPALLDKVCKETGWDKPWILGEESMTPAEPPAATPAEPEEKSPETGSDEDITPPAEEEQPPEETGIADLSRSEIDNAGDMIIATDAATGIVALSDGTLFDPAWYAESNPDVVAKYGSSTEALIAHYIKFGKKEGRPPLRPVTVEPKPVQTTTWEAPQTESHDDDDDDEDDHDDHGNSSSTSSQQGQTSPWPITTYSAQTRFPLVATQPTGGAQNLRVQRGFPANGYFLENQNAVYIGEAGTVTGALGATVYNGNPNYNDNTSKTPLPGKLKLEYNGLANITEQPVVQLPVRIDAYHDCGFDANRLDNILWGPTAGRNIPGLGDEPQTYQGNDPGQYGIKVIDAWGNSVVQQNSSPKYSLTLQGDTTPIWTGDSSDDLMNQIAANISYPALSVVETYNSP